MTFALSGITRLNELQAETGIALAF